MAWRRLLGDPAVEKYVEVVCKSGGLSKSWTLYSVLAAVDVFCRANQLTPSEMIMILKSSENCGKFFVNFLHFLRSQGYTSITIRRYMSGLKDFLIFHNAFSSKEWNYINRLKRRIFGRKLTSNIYSSREGELTQEMIRDILIEGCRSRRERVMVLVMATSGMSFADLLERKIGDFENLWEKRDCYMVEYIRRKSGIKTVTFITPETRRWILKYLTKREKKGEKITKDSPLLVNENGAPLARGTAIKIMRRIFERAELDEIIGVDAGGRKRYTYHPSLLRKYFRTALRNAGIDRIYVEAMMGHDIYSRFGIEMIYDKQADDPDILRIQYLRALPELTFTEPPPVTYFEKLRILQEEIERLETRIRKLAKRRLKRL